MCFFFFLYDRKEEWRRGRTKGIKKSKEGRKINKGGSEGGRKLIRRKEGTTKKKV